MQDIRNRSVGIDPTTAPQHLHGSPAAKRGIPPEYLWRGQRIGINRQASGDHADLIVSGQTLQSSGNATGGSYARLRGAVASSALHSDPHLYGLRMSSGQQSKPLVSHSNLHPT